MADGQSREKKKESEKEIKRNSLSEEIGKRKLKTGNKVWKMEEKKKISKTLAHSKCRH